MILAHCARAFNAFMIEEAIQFLTGLPNIWYDTSAVCDVMSHYTLFKEEDHRNLNRPSQIFIRSLFLLISRGETNKTPDPRVLLNYREGEQIPPHKQKKFGKNQNRETQQQQKSPSSPKIKGKIQQKNSRPPCLIFEGDRYPPPTTNKKK